MNPFWIELIVALGIVALFIVLLWAAHTGGEESGQEKILAKIRTSLRNQRARRLKTLPTPTQGEGK